MMLAPMEAATRGMMMPMSCPEYPTGHPNPLKRLIILRLTSLGQTG